jgi:hypothetical protein
MNRKKKPVQAAVDTLPRFDAKAAWAALSPDQQRELGEAAMLLHYTIEGTDRTAPAEPALCWALEAGSVAAATLLRQIANPSLPSEFGIPDLTVFGIHQCRGCGCTDAHACPGGCSWVGPDLCSTCDG